MSQSIPLSDDFLEKEKGLLKSIYNSFAASLEASYLAVSLDNALLRDPTDIIDDCVQYIERTDLSRFINVIDKNEVEALTHQLNKYKEAIEKYGQTLEIITIPDEKKNERGDKLKSLDLRINAILEKVEGTFLNQAEQRIAFQPHL